MKKNTLNDFLMLGSVGQNHLITAAQKGFSHADKVNDAIEKGELISTSARLLGMAWYEFILNAPLAREVVRLGQIVPSFMQLLGQDGVRLASHIAGHGQGADSLELKELFSRQQFDEVSEYLEKHVCKENLLPMLRQAVMYQAMLSRWDWLISFIRRHVIEHEPEIGQLLLAEVFLAAGRFDRAKELYTRLIARYGKPFLGYRLAVAMAQSGNTEEAATILQDVLMEFPQHISALLFLENMIFPASRDIRLEGTCVVSIYSYNKADALAKTLESVLASDLSGAVGDVKLRVLINGSEDESLQVAKTACAQFDGDIDIVDLPVNVGAPAARNWLLDAALKDGAQWIVYLDDDVIVPHDWLSGLAAGTRDFPDAGAWGCRVCDATSPNLTQHCDGYILSPEDALHQGVRVSLQEPSTESTIPAQLEYRRYAASVTGCCHLFKVDTLAEQKGFDLLFSPSQFDDLDLDLRMLFQGRAVAYLGDVVVAHLRVSNQLSSMSDAARIQSDNHRSLFEERHANHLETMCRVQTEYIEADLAKKVQRLQSAGVLPLDFSL